MNQILPYVLALFKKFLRLIALEFVALLISLVLIITFFALFTFSIEPPPIGEKDLGGAMLVFYLTIGSLFFSLPLSVLVHIFIFWKFFIRRRKKDER